MTEQTKKPRIRIHYDTYSETSHCYTDCAGNLFGCHRQYNSKKGKGACSNEEAELSLWYELISGELPNGNM